MDVYGLELTERRRARSVHVSSSGYQWLAMAFYTNVALKRFLVMCSVPLIDKLSHCLNV